MTSEAIAAEVIGGLDNKNDKAFLGHPKGLGYLAFTEAWERFSYYGMLSLLTLYMSKYLLTPGHIENIAFFPQFRSLFGDASGTALSSAIYGTYAALVYFTPTIGGFIADNFIGRRRAVLAGALSMALGHFLMAFEQSFLFALLALVIGSGLFKGNLASQIGGLYGPNDLRRADAFQIYYLAINIGVITAPLISGTLGEKIGWHWGFGAAGIGMLIAIIIYIAGQKHLPKDLLDNQDKKEKVKLDPLTKDDWSMLAVILILMPVIAVGVLPNQQIFNVYTVWGDRDFNLMFMGEKLPTTWLITLDAVVSVSFLAIVAIFFRWYGTKWKEPDEITKLIIGSAFAVGGMLCLYMAAITKAEGEKIGMFWPVAFHFVNSIGFALVLPVALALFVRLAPKRLVSTATGLYSMIFFFANALVGWIGGFFDKMDTAQFWLMHAGFAAASGAVFIILKIVLKKKLAAG